MKRRKKFIITPVLSVLLIIISCIVFYNDSNGSKPVFHTDDYNDKLVVHFLDVGQGDSAFIEFPNDECMLIDAGTSDCDDIIIDTVESYGYSRIDYIIATHPHADHIGAMSSVIDYFDIGEIYMPNISSNSKTFENLLQTISDNGLQVNTACADKIINTESELEIEFFSPQPNMTYDDLNNYSAVLKITYGDDAFLFTGDAENIAEADMMDLYSNELDCDVLKVGHHGSDSSSSEEFLNAATPQYAVISCGNHNSYGHPHKETLNRLESMGTKVYRTDKQGTITFISDGQNSIEILNGENE